VHDPSPNLFLEACGSSDPLRVGLGSRDGMGSETRDFRQPFLVIGRGADSDLMLDHWQVSRRHAYLQLLGGRYFCVDLGSRTGTHGGDSTERMGWLEDGRALQIGPFTVRPETPPATAPAPRQSPGVTWELPGLALGQSLWRMDQDIVLIGRSPACRIRMVEHDVSKFHCSLVATRMGVWAVDLLGQKGLFVNDRPVRSARLEDGDVLRVGRHELRPRYDTPPPPLPSGDPAASEPIATAPDELPARIDHGGDGDIVPFKPPPGREIAAFVEPPTGVGDTTVTALVHQFGMMQQQMFDQFHHTMMMMFEGFAALHRETSGNLRDEFEEVRKLSREIEALRAETTRLAEAASRPPDRLRPPPLNGHGPGRPSGDPIMRATPPPPDPKGDIHSQLLKRLSTIESERQNRWQKILGMMSSKS